MLHIYIGYDPVDALAYQVLERSIVDNVPHGRKIEIHPLRDWELRRRGFYNRPHLIQASGRKTELVLDGTISTDFSLTRFLVPMIHFMAGRTGPALFMDADMMVTTDIGELFDLADDSYLVQVVKHNYQPEEKTKIIGQEQRLYPRKNWSSVMLFPNGADIPLVETLSPATVNSQAHDWLHGFAWCDSDLIGDLPETWNWLEGWSKMPPAHELPANVHYTRGTPDIPEWKDVAYAEEWWAYAYAAGFLGFDRL